MLRLTADKPYIRNLFKDAERAGRPINLANMDKAIFPDTRPQWLRNWLREVKSDYSQ